MSDSTAAEKYFRSLNAYVKKLETPKLISLRKALAADARGAEIVNESNKISKKKVKR